MRQADLDEFLNRGARPRAAEQAPQAPSEEELLSRTALANRLQRSVTWVDARVRGGTDLVLVAELLGHARLETTRRYTHPTAEDRRRALDLLLVDE